MASAINDLSLLYSAKTSRSTGRPKANCASATTSPRTSTPELTPVILEILLLAEEVKGEIVFNCNTGPVTIPNAQLVALLFGESDFRLRALVAVRHSTFATQHMSTIVPGCLHNFTDAASSVALSQRRQHETPLATANYYSNSPAHIYGVMTLCK